MKEASVFDRVSSTASSSATRKSALAVAATSHGLHAIASQIDALDTLLEFASGHTPHGIATLSGFAGVGKTTVVALLLAALKGSLKVAVTAPTHKALAVLGDKLGTSDADLMTTQAALGLRLRELEGGEQRLQKEGATQIGLYDLVVIDEASMICPDIFAALLAARASTRLLFVGDPAQLAPVGSEEPSPAFGDIVPLHVVLTEVTRQAAEHPSIRLSVALREDVARERAPGLDRLAALLVPDDAQYMTISPGGDATLHTQTIDALRHGLDTRILAFTNRACLRHNAALHDALYPGVPGFAQGEEVIAQDSFLMRGKNGTPLQVRTSQLLTIESLRAAAHPESLDVPAWLVRLRTEDGCTGEAWVAQDRTELEYGISTLFAQWRALKMEGKPAEAKKASAAAWALRSRYAHLRHAYALTIHKSQGSTFETVLIDWSSLPCDGGAGTARLAYVAITRPSRFAVIVTQ